MSSLKLETMIWKLVRPRYIYIHRERERERETESGIEGRRERVKIERDEGE